MGANFEYLKYDGKLKFNEVVVKFKEAQDQDRYENGSSYSGTIGMLYGEPVGTKKVFPDEQEAVRWLQDNHEKRKPALAVKAYKTTAPTFGGSAFDVSGRTYSDQVTRFVPADQLTAPQKAKLLDLCAAFKTARDTYDRHYRDLDDLIRRLRDFETEFTDYAGIERERNLLVKLRTDQKTAQTALEAYDKELRKDVYKPTEETVWLVGGNCPS